MARKRRQSGCSTFLTIVILVTVYIPLILMTVISPIIMLLDYENGEDDIAKGFTIESYNVLLIVKEDNKVFVEETITVNWEEEGHHGIYRTIPKWLEYSGKDGKTIKRKSKVNSLVALNEQYSSNYRNRKAKIKIGNPNLYVPLGEKQYVISYTYDMGSDPFKNFDEFIFHTYGDYWGTEIKNASVEVLMPKSIEGYNINFFADKYRTNNVNQFVDYKVNDNTLFAKFDGEKYKKYQYDNYCSNKYNLNIDGTCKTDGFESNYKPLNKSLTIDIELPNNYFSKGSWNYGWGSFTIIIIIITLTILNICKWKKYGKNFPKKAKTVEFYPPENLNSAEVGYIYNRHSTKKLTISLIIQLASKGYIKIDELEDKKIQITNLYPKPKELKSLEKELPKRIISINKLKDSNSNLSSNATAMMDYLFKNTDSKKLSYNIEEFLKVKDELVNGGYIKITNDNENEVIKKTYLIKKEYKQKELQYNHEMEEYQEKLSKLKPLSEYEEEVYGRLFKTKDEIILSEHKTLYRAFENIDSLLKSKLKDKIIDATATSKMKSSIAICIIISILHVIGYYLVEDMHPSWSILYTISFICIFINILLTLIMKRKTNYGEQITAKVLGFREFLIKVEKPKLEELVAENPQYFYDILPYTYVLNVSKTWIKKFEDIPIPEIDMGNINYSSDFSIYSLYDNLYIPKTETFHSSSSSSSRGCSSCSSCGGCGGGSSGGGGCSSCGGGGSW